MTNLIIILIVIFSTSVLNAQSIDRSSYYSYGKQFYAESHVLPAKSADSIKIIVFYQIMYDAITFLQENPNRNTDYRGTSTVEIVIKDVAGIIKKRALVTDTLLVKDYEKTNSKTDFLPGGTSLTLQKGDYNIEVLLIDKYGKQLQNIEITTKNYNFYYDNVTSAPIFAKVTPGDSDVFIPFILNGDVSFAANQSYAIIPISYTDPNNQYYFSIEKAFRENISLVWPGEFSHSGLASLIPNSTLAIKKDNGSPLELRLTNAAISENQKNQGLLLVEFPTASMFPGYYKFNLYSDNNPDTIKYTFNIVWEDMPLSLRSIDYAVEAMYYILTDEQYSNIKSGNDNEQFRKLLEFWQLKDPTPVTIFNEAMNTYFTRVDYAFFNYQTLIEKDGAKTDRGKIYILYGPPGEITSELLKGKTVEYWKYDRLNKTFIFNMVVSGVYQLTEIEEHTDSDSSRK